MPLLQLVSTIIIGISASWLRMFIALALSIAFSLVVGISAATNKSLERVILPTLDVLQTIPILGFFPVVIYLVVLFLPNFVGINIAVIFLIFTSMSWNIAFGVYEAVKSIPSELVEAARLSGFSKAKMFTSIYAPASLPRIAYQSTISWSIGLFYLVTSEIFSTGSKAFAVKYGIGVEVAKIALSHNIIAYITLIVLFVIAVVLTRIFFLKPLSLFSEKYSFKEEFNTRNRSAVLSFYSKVNALVSPGFRKFSLLLIESIPRAKAKKNAVFEHAKEKHFGRRRIRHYIKLATEITLILFSSITLLLLIKIGFFANITIVLLALFASFARVWFTYLICVAVAVPLGITIGLSKKAYEPALSTLQVISAIPATLLLPAIVALMFFLPYSGEMVALSVIFLAMVWYLLFSIISGMRTIPAQVFEVKEMLGLKRLQAWKNIYLPAIMPAFITGSITAIGGAWNALIVAEYFTISAINGSASNSTVLTQVGTGIGKLIDQSVFQGNLELTLVAIFSMTVMVIGINRLVWQRLYNKYTSRIRGVLQ
ncbi:MAG: ABC transporter permease subunit [Candidatus Micrarchaeia archaeon]